MTATRPAGTAVDRRTVRWVLAALAVFLPMALAAAGPWTIDVFLLYLGLLPTLVALREGRRVAMVTALATPLVVVAGVLLSGSPVLGTLFLAALGAGVTWSWSRGWPGAGTYVVTQAALATISPPAGLVVGGRPGGSAALPDPVAVAAILFAGLWVVLVGRLMLFDLPTSPHEPPGRSALLRHAATLVPLVAVATYVTMTWGPGLHAWWVVLSLLVIVQPDPRASARRAVERVLGTVVGAAGAALVVVVAGRSTATSVLGVLLAVASAVAYLKASYWVFTTLLTAALVLLTFAPGTVAQQEAERVGFTLVAAAAVVVVGLGLDRVGRSRGSRTSGA